LCNNLCNWATFNETAIPITAGQSGSQNAVEVNIVGDDAWGVFNTPYKADIDHVFTALERVNSLMKVFNYKYGRWQARAPAPSTQTPASHAADRRSRDEDELSTQSAFYLASVRRFCLIQRERPLDRGSQSSLGDAVEQLGELDTIHLHGQEFEVDAP
jgi:hypothetical protein